jgi:hydrogenase-4 component F
MNLTSPGLLVVLLLAPWLLACAAAFLVRTSARWVGWFGVVAAVLSFAVSLRLVADLLRGGPMPAGPDDIFRIDALSAVLTVCITFVSLLAVILGPGFSGSDPDARGTRRFRVGLTAFAPAMLLAVTTQNVAIMWVAIEATTIASALVIPLTRTKASVEASWKYMLICSVGIALAFTGTVLAYFDFVSTAGPLPGALNFSVLQQAAPSLHRELIQLAFAFILVGYGTKAGLAPMHTWLPDAYSEAPSPIAAMMSGVLVAVAMYAIARWKAVVDVAVAPEFTNTLLIGAGLLSVGIGAFSLVIQRHYKRMLAYSSVEHMGLVSLGLALGPLGMFAALLHLVNHALAKSMTFLLAGRILSRYRTTEIAGVTGLLQAMPWTGGLFAAGVLALIGLPPFGLFISEFLLVRAAVSAGRLWVAAAIALFILMAFVSLLRHLNAMLYGPVPDGVETGERRTWSALALAGCVAVLIVLGLVLPWPVRSLLDQSVTVLTP